MKRKGAMEMENIATLVLYILLLAFGIFAVVVFLTKFFGN
jgi:heme/copper-type cytochrome/quinol oxidase subunit 2